MNIFLQWTSRNIIAGSWAMHDSNFNSMKLIFKVLCQYILIYSCEWEPHLSILLPILISSHFNLPTWWSRNGISFSFYFAFPWLLMSWASFYCLLAVQVPLLWMPCSSPLNIFLLSCLSFLCYFMGVWLLSFFSSSACWAKSRVVLVCPWNSSLV